MLWHQGLGLSLLICCCIASLLSCTSSWMRGHTAYQSEPANVSKKVTLRGVVSFQVSHKPRSISHAEAASIPYVASTALSALVNAGGLCKERADDKRQVSSADRSMASSWFAVVFVCSGLSPGDFTFFLTGFSLFPSESSSPGDREESEPSLFRSAAGASVLTLQEHEVPGCDCVCVCVFLSLRAGSYWKPGVHMLPLPALKTPKASWGGWGLTRWWATQPGTWRSSWNQWRGMCRCFRKTLAYPSVKNHQTIEGLMRECGVFAV